MGIFSKKRRNNETELRERCLGGLITIYKLLVVKVGEEEMKKFSESSTNIRGFLFGHISNTYSYSTDSDPMQWNSNEGKFVQNTLDSFMQSEGIYWDKNETYVSLEDTEFTMQGTAISKALIEEKDPDKWMLLLEKTAENIKACNSKI
jgi:hypothetical protein